jgi:hypothetical protein
MPILIQIGIKTDPHADPTPKFNTCWKIRNLFFTFNHSIATLQCFIFLVSVKCDIFFSILDGILKSSGEKVYIIIFFICLELIPDPDRLAEVPDHDPSK